MDKKFIVWYEVDGEEDFTIITALDEDDARHRFYRYSDRRVVEIREIDMTSEAWLAYI